jgi:hypothetical protein
LEKNEIANKMERVNEDEENRDGKLMAELNNIQENEKFNQ